MLVASAQKITLRIYQVTAPTLTKVFECRHASSQLSILANQIPFNAPYMSTSNQLQIYKDLMHRSTTDLTTNLVIEDSLFHHCSVELNKHPVTIEDVHCKVMETKLLLVLVLANHKIIVYEGLTDFSDIKTQTFRFKIV